MPFRSPLLRQSLLLSFPGGTEMFPELPVPRLCTSHRSWIAPCSTLGSRRYTRIAPWSTLSVLCWPRISPCPTLRSMHVRRLLRVRRLMLAPFADCSALDTWRSMSGSDCSVPRIMRPALVADRSVPIALRLRFACGLLRSQPVRLVPHTDCSVDFPRRCAPLMDFSTLDTWRSHRSQIAPRSTLGASCFMRIAPLSTLGVLCWTRIAPRSTLSAHVLGPFG